MSETLITAHFSVEEMRCHDGTPYPLALVETHGPDEGRTWLETRLRPLCETLELIRAGAGGFGIQINSGYRSLAYNRRLGSKDTSQHVAGRAVDIVHARYTPQQFHGIVLAMFRRGELPMLGGLGNYARFTHIDVRPRPEDDHLAQWSGSRASNEAS